MATTETTPSAVSKTPSAPNKTQKSPTKTPAKPATKAVVKPVAKKTLSVKALDKTPVAPKKAPPKAAAQPAAEKPTKAKKIKMVRDSFTIPKPEFAVLDALKLRAVKLAAPVKKTEVIRAGIKALAAMADTEFLAALRAVPSLKTGRPAKS